MIHDTQSAQISQKQDERNSYAIMKIMCPPDYHHNGFVATQSNIYSVVGLNKNYISHNFKFHVYLRSSGE